MTVIEFRLKWLALAGLLCGVYSANAQDLDPRRWSHLPVNINYAGAAYAYMKGDVIFDPVLELENVKVDANSYGAKYLRSFKLLDRSARFELAAPYQDVHWKGLQQGEPASTSREGFADPQIRIAFNVIGAPPLSQKDFAAWRSSHKYDTTVGIGMTVTFPFGEYYDDKLLNLGENRYTFRPEIGVEHRNGKWLAELTGSASFYTDNDEFWNGNTREQEMFFISQGILSYTFRPGLWLSGGIGYGWGGESTINGSAKDDAKLNRALGLALGIPFNRSVGMKIAYLNINALEDTGTDSDTFATAVSVLW